MSRNRNNRINYAKKFIPKETKINEEDISIKDVDDNVERVVKENKQEMGEVNIPKDLKLNLRISPNKDSDILKQLSPFEIVMIYQENHNEWVKVCTASGIEGYVLKEFIKFV